MAQHSLLTHIALSVDLREGPEGVRSLLALVAKSEHPPTSRDIAIDVRMPLPIVAALRAELEKADLLKRSPHGMELSERGRQFVQDELGLVGGGMVDSGDLSSLPARPDSSVSLDDLTLAITPFAKERPSADVRLDQAKATPETIARRAALLLDRGAVEGRRILILGDDDFTSVALGVLMAQLGVGNRVGSWRELTVVEVDPRITLALTKIAEAEGYDINVINHDLTDPLPERLMGRYDVVLTDPPYTTQGVELFCSRAVQALAAGVGKYLFLCYGHKDPEHMHQIQTGLLNMGLVISECWQGFNEYEGAAILANRGQMIVLRTTTARKPIVEDHYSGLLYTGDVRPTRREYSCQGCGERIFVGKGQKWDTITALKEEGCPECGESKFAMRSRGDSKRRRRA